MAENSKKKNNDLNNNNEYTGNEVLQLLSARKKYDYLNKEDVYIQGLYDGASRGAKKIANALAKEELKKAIHRRRSKRKVIMEAIIAMEECYDAGVRPELWILKNIELKR